MGDISTYGTRTTVAGTDRMFIATGASPQIESTTLDLLLPSVSDGTTTLTGVGTIVLDGGTVSGSNGGTSALGSATLTITGGGGFSPGPISGIAPFTRDALSSFGTSVVGAEAAVYTDFGSGKPIQVQQAGANANGWDYRVKAAPSLPFTVTAMAEFNPFLPAFVVGAPIILIDSSGQFIAFTLTGGAVGINFSYWTSPTSFDTNNTIGASSTYPAALWVRAVVDSSNITGFLSSNGIDWSQVFQVGLTSFLVSAPVAMGFGMNADSTGPGAIGLDMSLWNWVQT